jgi:hypothetical protein
LAGCVTAGALAALAIWLLQRHSRESEREGGREGEGGGERDKRRISKVRRGMYTYIYIYAG